MIQPSGHRRAVDRLDGDRVVFQKPLVRSSSMKARGARPASCPGGLRGSDLRAAQEPSLHSPLGRRALRSPIGGFGSLDLPAPPPPSPGRPEGPPHCAGRSIHCSNLYGYPLRARLPCQSTQTFGVASSIEFPGVRNPIHCHELSDARRPRMMLQERDSLRQSLQNMLRYNITSC